MNRIETYEDLANWEKERVAAYSKGNESRSFKAKIAQRERLRIAAAMARDKYELYAERMAPECPHTARYLVKETSTYEDDWAKQGSTTTRIKCSRCDQKIHEEERHYSW